MPPGPMVLRLAWDEQYYTQDDFLLWYGRERGFEIWEEAGNIEGSDAQHVDNEIAISFVLLSGDKACEDVVISRTRSTTARVIRDHLRRNSREDRIRKLDWDSTLLIAGKILDLGYDDVFSIEEAKIMLAQNPRCPIFVRISCVPGMTLHRKRKSVNSRCWSSLQIKPC